MKKLLTITFALFALIFVSGQEALNFKKYNNLHYHDATIMDNESYTVSVKNAVAQEDFVKLAIIIENKTNDYLLFEAGECGFAFENGEQKPKKKEYLIQPHKSITKTLQISSKGPYKVDNFNFNFRGLYRISSEGKIVPAPNFILPETVNSFSAGDFEISLKGKKKETKVTTVNFNCLYSGDAIGLVNASKLSVMIEGGQTFANNNKKAKTKLLQKGDKVKLIAVFNIPAKIVDMQFADLTIVWNDTFTSSEKINLNVGESIIVKLDVQLTKDKK